jgi:hypothetical protein
VCALRLYFFHGLPGCKFRCAKIFSQIADADAFKLFFGFCDSLWLSAGHYANAKTRLQGGVFAKADLFLNG